MSDILEAVGGAVLVLCSIAVGLFVGALICTFMGAAVGWIVGLLFGNTILDIAAQIGIRDVTMWQLGAFLGFVGGFFRVSVSSQRSPQ